MCGYIGFTNKIKDPATVLENMKESIRHRGPDSDGSYIDDDICMGFRRLSIIDLDEGDQPLFNEDKSLVLTFNGEIYNYKILRAELEKSGHVFSTHSDSEVLLHGYEQYGRELVTKLRGMFSFVIWDKNSKTLFGARDMFGIKPLYYAEMDGTFMYGSEIKAFLYHPSFKKELNEQALAHYLSFQYSPLEETFFKGVYKLPPAHSFTYKDGVFLKERYFKPDFKAEEGSFPEFTDKTEAAVMESVTAHKIADVEVGSFLSSGIDSSYIASAAKVDKTFTVGFAGEKYNEISYAKRFSEIIGVENINKEISSEEYFVSFPDIQYHMDEPLADPAAIALYFVSKIASEHVKVVLSGEGADELFGGYKVYREPLTCTKYNKIPLVIRRMIGAIASLFPARRGFNFLVRRGGRLEDWFIGNANIFSYKERRKILKCGLSAPAPKAVCKRFYDEASSLDDVTKMQYLDINMWLMGDILLKADKTSMANSLELRVPFLDKNIMALAQTIPTEYRVDSANTKKALRAAAARTIPEFTANKEKLGFPVPIRVWLKEDKYYNMVENAFKSATAERFFNAGRLLKLLAGHRAGKTDNSRKIWTIYTFLIWYEEYFIKR